MKTETVHSKLYDAYEDLRGEFWAECEKEIGEKETEKLAEGLERVFFKRFSAEVSEALWIIAGRERIS